MVRQGARAALAALKGNLELAQPTHEEMTHLVDLGAGKRPLHCLDVLQRIIEAHGAKFGIPGLAVLQEVPVQGHAGRRGHQGVTDVVL